MEHKLEHWPYGEERVLSREEWVHPALAGATRATEVRVTYVASRGGQTRAGDPRSRCEGPDLSVWDQEDGVLETEPGRPRDEIKFGR